MEETGDIEPISVWLSADEMLPIHCFGDLLPHTQNFGQSSKHNGRKRYENWAQ